MEKKEHIISILVYNKPDVLARIAGTLGGKGYNIESLSVNTTTQYEISKIVMTSIGNQATISRIENQLQRLKAEASPEAKGKRIGILEKIDRSSKYLLSLPDEAKKEILAQLIKQVTVSRAGEVDIELYELQ